MADFPEVGIKLVVDNKTGFVTGIETVNKSVTGLGTSAAGAIGGVKGMAGAMLLGNAAFAAAQAVIGSVIGAVTGVVQAFEQMAVAAFRNATELQNLTISLESLAAREELSAGRATNMTDALEQAGPVAEDLLKQIRDLSVASPFQYQDIIQVFRLNMAFGQTADTSVKLTKAITDIAAASGQGSQIMQRLAYNFSQMSLTGQVTMRDVRDLAMAGFDLSRVFREELSMSIEEVNTALKSGKMTMQDVSNAFVKYADENFGGAAKRMSQTITGVVSSIKDLGFFMSTDILGGAVNNLGIAFSNMFDRLRGIVDSGIFQVIGVTLEVLTSKVAEASTKIPTFSEKMLGTMGDKFMAFAEKTFEYGLNIMEQFAIGIIDGASYVIDAVMYIVDAIATMLMPGSPPKALPDIGKWGTGAFNEYLKGFTDADFDILKGVQRSVQSALSIMGTDKTGKQYLGYSTGLAKMLSTGTIDEGFLAKMAKGLGPYGAEIAKLTRMEMQLAIATEAVNNARKKENQEMTKLQRMVFEYNKAIKEGADPSTMKAQRDMIDAQVAQTDAAVDARVEAEKKLDEIAVLEEQVKLQRELVSAMLEMGAAMKRAADMANKGGGGGGGGGPLANIGDAIERAATEWEKKLDAFRERLKTKLDDVMTKVGEHFKQSSIGKLLTAIGQAFNIFGMGENEAFPQDQPGMAASGWMAGISKQLTGIQDLYKILTGQDINLDQAMAFQQVIKDIGTAISEHFSIEKLDGIAKSFGTVIGVLLALGVGSLLANVWIGFDMLALSADTLNFILGNTAIKLSESYDWFIKVKDESVKLATKIGELITKIGEFATDVTLKLLGEKGLLVGLYNGFLNIVGQVKKFVDLVGAFITLVLGGQFGAALALLKPFISSSPAPMAVGLSQINTQLDKVMRGGLMDLAYAVNGTARPPAQASSQSIAYNVPITVNANVGSDQDIHKLAYVIASEFNKRTSR